MAIIIFSITKARDEVANISMERQTTILLIKVAKGDIWSKLTLTQEP